MKIRTLLVGLLLVGFFSGTAKAQSDTLVSYTLAWSIPALASVQKESYNSEKEVIGCMTGRVTQDTIFVDSLYLPKQTAGPDTVINTEVCPKNTIVIWHTHIWKGVNVADGITSPFDMCYLSTKDIHASLMDKPYVAAVSVGGLPEGYLIFCWFSYLQIQEFNKHHPFSALPALSHQGFLAEPDSTQEHH